MLSWIQYRVLNNDSNDNNKNINNNNNNNNINSNNIKMVGQFRLIFQITVKLKRVDLKVQNFVWRVSDQGSFKTVKFVGTQ